MIVFRRASRRVNPRPRHTPGPVYGEPYIKAHVELSLHGPARRPRASGWHPPWSVLSAGHAIPDLAGHGRRPDSPDGALAEAWPSGRGLFGGRPLLGTTLPAIRRCDSC